MQQERAIEEFIRTKGVSVWLSKDPIFLEPSPQGAKHGPIPDVKQVGTEPTYSPAAIALSERLRNKRKHTLNQYLANPTEDTFDSMLLEYSVGRKRMEQLLLGADKEFNGPDSKLVWVHLRKASAHEKRRQREYARKLDLYERHLAGESVASLAEYADVAVDRMKAILKTFNAQPTLPPTEA